MYKIHIPDVPREKLVGELKNILIAGVNRNRSTELCVAEEDADYILLDHRHLEGGLYGLTNPEKTIIVDYRDQQQSVFPHESLLYFKRSVVDKRKNTFVQYSREILPISYCVREEYVHHKSLFRMVREIDVAVFFEPAPTQSQARNYYRDKVARYIRDELKELNLFVGTIGNVGPVGRNAFQQLYFETMTNAKIVVTCNPDRWEGDYRLFEALSSGCLVMSDRMITPVVNPFIDGEHLVYYEKENLEPLGDTIRELLSNQKKRLDIANNGYEHTMKFHTTGSRISEIIQAATLSGR